MLDGLLKWYLETTDVTPLAEGATAAYILTTFDPCVPRKQVDPLTTVVQRTLQMTLDTRQITHSESKSCGGRNSIRCCIRSIKQ